MPLPQFNPMAAAMMMQNPFMNPMSMGGGMPIPQCHPAASSLGNGKTPFTAQGAPPAEIGTARGAKRAATNATQSSTKASKRANKKKVKGKPKRPLSAYNLFFKDERERILNDIPKKEEDDADNAGSNKEEEEKEEEGGGEGDANAIGVKPKKKPHGKIGFESLAKLIGKRWQELESVEVDKYKKLAEEDAKRYKAEMEVFLTKEANSEETDGGGEAKKRKLNSD
ncbi:hypothetical protein ACHAWO_007674 [Cyclotella atomus]|uniref:HMG box domain-containing protein n=1 Tax=Cyclotella atomus TaxID=382360 RepID=A0ABD3Q784_9STRA